MDLALAINPGTGAPLHRQVYEGIRAAILAGKLRPGERLPPTRVLAGQLSLSRMTVSDAYYQLRVEGYVLSRRGSGTYVAPNIQQGTLPGRTDSRAHSAPDLASHLSPWGRRVGTVSEHDNAATLRWDLPPYRVADDLFPWDTWEDATQRALAVHRQALASPAPPNGFGLLREAISGHVTQYRAVICSPDQVVIVTGSQQGLNLLAQLLLTQGDRAAVEDPGYPAARQALEVHGANVSRIPVDAEGISVEALARAGRQRLVYVTPSHQHPTGATLSLSRRLALLELARRERTVIVEDDYDSEFRYEGSPVESLQGLDRSSLVIYAGTFSKSVLAGLRIGFVVLPDMLVDAFVGAKSLWDGGTPMLEQAVLAEFITSGSFERHIRRMRRIYRARRDAFRAALDSSFGSAAKVGPCHGGLTALIEIESHRSADDISSRAAKHGLAIRSATPYYAVAPDRPRFLIGFGGLPESEAPSAVAALRSAASV